MRRAELCNIQNRTMQAEPVFPVVLNEKKTRPNVSAWRNRNDIFPFISGLIFSPCVELSFIVFRVDKIQVPARESWVASRALMKSFKRKQALLNARDYKSKP